MNVVPQKIYFGQLDQIRDNSRNILSNDNPEFVHDLRVAILKLEFVSKLFCEFISLDKGLKDQLKTARQRMGRVRDFDILLSNLDMTDPKLRSDIEIKRQKSRQRLVRALKAIPYKSLLKDLSGVYVSPKSVGRKLIAKKLSAAFKKVLKWKKKMDSVNGVHKTRIAFKELRYTCDFFNKAQRTEKLIRLITKFQNILGKFQDAVSAIDLVSKLPSTKNSKRINRFIKIEKNVIKNAEIKFEKNWKRDVPMIQKSLSCLTASKVLEYSYY